MNQKLTEAVKINTALKKKNIISTPPRRDINYTLNKNANSNNEDKK